MKVVWVSCKYEVEMGMEMSGRAKRINRARDSRVGGPGGVRCLSGEKEERQRYAEGILWTCLAALETFT